MRLQPFLLCLAFFATGAPLGLLAQGMSGLGLRGSLIPSEQASTTCRRQIARHLVLLRLDGPS